MRDGGGGGGEGEAGSIVEICVCGWMDDLERWGR